MSKQETLEEKLSKFEDKYRKDIENIQAEVEIIKRDVTKLVKLHECDRKTYLIVFAMNIRNPQSMAEEFIKICNAC